MKVSNFSFENAKKIELEIILPTPPPEDNRRFTWGDDGSEFDTVVYRKKVTTHQPIQKPHTVANLFLTEREITLMKEKKLNVKVGQEMKLHYLLGKTVRTLYFEKHGAKYYSESNIKKMFRFFKEYENL